MVLGNVEGNLDTCRRLVTRATLESTVQGSSRSRCGGKYGTACLIAGHNTFRGSMPNFFMREISVVRLMSMRAAAPSGPATRPFVTFRMRTISLRSLASRVSITGTVLPLLVSSLIGASQRRAMGKDH